MYVLGCELDLNEYEVLKLICKNGDNSVMLGHLQSTILFIEKVLKDNDKKQTIGIYVHRT